jgi:hypothetical protein
VYEHRSHPLLPRRVFLRRLSKSVGLMALLIGVALGIGVVGYHALAGLGWIDSVLNASMILSGMGPVGDLRTDGAKLFASAYALFSGVVFLSAFGIVGAPILHRFLHRFHLEHAERTESRHKS